MKEINMILKIVNDYLFIYRKEFYKIESKSSTEVSLKYVKTSYFNDNNISDTFPIHRYYRDYDFLNDLGKYEKEKILFLYSLKKYIDYLDFFENLDLKVEYLYYLIFDFDEEEIDSYFKESEIIMFPSLVYYFSEDKNLIIGKINWRNTVKFGKYIPKIKSYFEEIIKDVGLENYLELTYNYSDIGYQIFIDFKFDYGKYKKKVKDYIR